MARKERKIMKGRKEEGGKVDVKERRETSDVS